MTQTNAARDSEIDRAAAPEADVADRPGAEDFERLRQALAEQSARNLGLRADLENFRRRAANEQESAQQRGRRAAVLPLLPVFDTLERAVATGSTDSHFFEGVAATLRLFTDALLEAGAEPFDTVGLEFDPAIHEAVEIVRRSDVKAGTVTGQALRGWRLDGDLLRPARVIVSADADDSK